MKTVLETLKVPSANFNYALIDSCRTGDQKAQFQIYKMYYKEMYNASLRIVNSPMEAEEIMQESFLSAFEKIETYTETVSFGAWLKKIVINLSIDFIDKERKIIFKDIDSFQKNVCDSIDDLSMDCGTDITGLDLVDEIKRLPDGYRIIISLYLLEGYNHEEIGAILSISPAASRSQFIMGKQMLYKELLRN
jgi:RNA polymerase sigma factor (sigma-70 family)